MDDGDSMRQHHLALSLKGFFREALEDMRTGGNMDRHELESLAKSHGLERFLPPPTPPPLELRVIHPFPGESARKAAERGFGLGAVIAFGENNQNPPKPWGLVGYVQGFFGVIPVHKPTAEPPPVRDPARAQHSVGMTGDDMLFLMQAIVAFGSTPGTGDHARGEKLLELFASTRKSLGLSY